LPQERTGRGLPTSCASPVAKPPPVPERAVRRAVRDWLDANRIPHIPIESRKPLRDKSGAIYFVSEQARDKGICDILALPRIRGWTLNPVPVAIEVKSSTGKQSEAQQEWQAWWTRVGFVYLLVHSVEELEREWPK